jgi:hypothetical protein
MSRQEFEALFQDDEACAEYLVNKRGPKASVVRLAAAKRPVRWTATDQHRNAQGVGGRL